MNMIAEFTANPHWFFMAFGGIMLAAELLGAGGYLLWSGISAITVGILAWVIPPISWEWLWLIFSVLTITIAVVWWRWTKKHPKQNQQKVNRRYGHLIGTRTKVTQAIINGSGRIKIADSTWLAKCSQDLAIGATVEVIGVDSITLEVKPIDD